MMFVVVSARVMLAGMTRANAWKRQGPAESADLTSGNSINRRWIRDAGANRGAAWEVSPSMVIQGSERVIALRRNLRPTTGGEVGPEVAAQRKSDAGLMAAPMRQAKRGSAQFELPSCSGRVKVMKLSARSLRDENTVSGAHGGVAASFCGEISPTA